MVNCVLHYCPVVFLSAVYSSSGQTLLFCWVPVNTDIVSGVKGGLVVEDEDVVGGSGVGGAGHEAALNSGPHGEAGGH